MAYDTALNIIVDSAVELGLVSFASKPTDVFGSTDPNIGLLCQLLKSVGRNLMRERQWTALQNTWAFQTSANVGRYSEPDDFDRVIDQTAWNRSTRLPLAPMSPQSYEFLSSRLQGATWNIFWRLLQGKFHAYPDTNTPEGYFIVFEYVSRYWAQPTGTQSYAGPWIPGGTFQADDYVQSGGQVFHCVVNGVAGSVSLPLLTPGSFSVITDGTAQWKKATALSGVAGADTVVANGDTVLFDPQLVRAALKLAYLTTRGFDSTVAMQDYQASLERAKNADKVAPVLSFGRTGPAEPLISPWNLPTVGR